MAVLSDETVSSQHDKSQQSSRCAQMDCAAVAVDDVVAAVVDGCECMLLDLLELHIHLASAVISSLNKLFSSSSSLGCASFLFA